MKNRIRRKHHLLSFAALVLLATSIWTIRPTQQASHEQGPVQPSEQEHSKSTVVETSVPPEPPIVASRSSLDTAPQEVQAIPTIRVYKVQPGDTLESIANQFGLQVTSIQWSNDISDEKLLQIDQELLIPPVDGIIHTVREGDTFWDIARIHGVEVDAIIQANPRLNPDTLQPGHQLIVPGGKPARSPRSTASRSGTDRDDRAPIAAPVLQGLLWPVTGEVTDTFGWRTHPVYGTPNFHEGIDIGIPEGTPIRATADGKVIFAGWYGGWGLTVKLDHGDGLVSRYSHTRQLMVSVGDTVTAGQVIALSGNTGISTGPHVDFGIYLSDEPVDPLSLLPR